MNRAAEVKAGEEHRSIVTEADGISNERILSSLRHYHAVRFLCEEGSDDTRVLSPNLPDGILTCLGTAVVDSLDGTSRFAGKWWDNSLQLRRPGSIPR